MRFGIVKIGIMDLRLNPPAMAAALLLFVPALLAPRPIAAQSHKHHDHGHAHHGETAKPIEPPKIFLDKSPRIVQYQLDRLDNERLLLVERDTSDSKYAPVYSAILTRPGISPQYREESLLALVEIHKSDAVTELLKTLQSTKEDSDQQRRTLRELAGMLLRQPGDLLDTHADALLEATHSKVPLLRSVGYAGLVTAGQMDLARSTAAAGEASTLDWLAAVSLLPSPDLRASLREPIVDLVEPAKPLAIRRAAVEALASVPNAAAETFRFLAPLVSDPQLRTVAVQSLLTIPQDQKDPATAKAIVETLVNHAESLPADQRTTDEFIDAMQLTDQLLAKIPVNSARTYRERLRAVTVRVVRIQTVDEEMRYDTPYFAVEAGRPVQVILQNEDLMPHNLVITVPGALKEVANLGLAAGPAGHQGKQYVPNSDKVLHATHMVESRKQERLTFTAPTQPGEYPYVCTFPRHWMRMYGVMVVVDDLDAWLQNPVPPKDPIGSNRSFVQAWTIDDFKGNLEDGLQGRSPEIGKRIFTEATCAQCHKAEGQGGAVGPELNGLLQRWKGDRLAVLREILEPSHRIDQKYAMHLVLTLDGRSTSGIVTAQDKTSVSILVNPEAKQPTVIQRSDIDEIVKTSTSMMPKALLDRFTRDEILELFAYLESLRPPVP